MELNRTTSDLAQQLGRILKENALKITTAESCTGGGISYALTDTAGSSAYLDACYVTYSNEAKHQLLGVSLDTLNNYGAVSEQTVKQMVVGALKAAGANIAVAVSGVAGPSGGSTEKPVGTVWVALSVNGKTYTYRKLFSGDRAEVRLQVIDFSLKKLIEKINDNF